MRRVVAVMLAWLGTMAAAQAAVVSDGPDKVSVTIYHEPGSDVSESYVARFRGLAVITETRSIDLPAGISEIRFRGVADTMVPQTADLDGLPQKPSEGNFNYDLLGDGRLIAGSLGQTVRLVRTDRNTGAVTETSAILRSGPDGVMLERDGKLEALGCSGGPEKLVFDRVPDGLYDVPTLTVRADVPSAGRYVMTLRYLASGLNWAANYVAHASADGRTVDLSGWITLANSADIGFPNAPVDVIAGRYNSTGEDQPLEVSALGKRDACWPTAINWATYPPRPAPSAIGFASDSAAPVMNVDEAVIVSGSIVARRFGDYKQYPLPEPTLVAAHQTKQVQFLDSRGISSQRIYRGMILVADSSGAQEEPKPADVVLKLRNDAASGLGKPLPAGDIATTTTLGGVEMLLAEDKIGDTPAGLKLEIPAGSAANVWFESRVTDKRVVTRRGAKYDRVSVEVTITNQKAVPVDFELWQATESESASLVSESRDHGAMPGGLAWNIPLDPGSQSKLRYTLDIPK